MELALNERQAGQIANDAATRFQTVHPTGEGRHARPGGEIRERRFAYAGLGISRHRRKRTARLSAGVGGAWRADRALHVSGGAALHAGEGACGNGRD